MKTKLIIAWLAATLFTTAALAQRRNADQAALELGVVAWLAALQTEAQPFDPAALKALYRPDVRTRDAEREMLTWAEYAAALRERFAPYAKITADTADDLRVTLEGTRAVTSFTLRPRLVHRDGREESPVAHFHLVWEKSGGWWSIVEQTIACSKKEEASTVVTR
jgi:ketosteroid isomerase-like protein